MRKPEEALLVAVIMTQRHCGKMRKKILLKEFNDVLICTLCNGYLIDATTLVDCNHVFCRGCILRHFENGKTECPSCKILYKKKGQAIFRADPQIQAIVYKLVPGLFSKEMQRREDFYRSTGVRANSACSDDSVLERERDLINDDEALVPSYVGDKTQFYGPEDLISLSLEYYQQNLDTTQKCKKNNNNEISNNNNNNNNNNGSKVKLNGSKNNNNNENSNSSGNDKSACDGDVDSGSHKGEGQEGREGCGEKRFLQCPAGVSMKHLQKFIRMKYAITGDHRVDIIYKGEVLPPHYSLMDVAYIFKWQRTKPLRFFYRIFTPLKIQPIKIVNTTLSSGTKQLQIVPVKSDPTIPPPAPSSLPPSLPPPPPKFDDRQIKEESEEKERLLANLQLQSCRTKVPENRPQVVQQDCVFDYPEVDKEEIKRFAEIRDREWALQKKLDEKEREKEKDRIKDKDDDYHHFSKKRKKNKHSKNDCVYKKRKLHAEITNKEEELKLKVKLTQPNGHKHKHHKTCSTSATSQIATATNTEQQQNLQHVSSKEKLLQMRQVRHKQVSSEDKNIQTVSKETNTDTRKVAEVTKRPENEKSSNGVEDAPKKCADVSIVTTSSPSNAKTLRSDFAVKTTLNKDWNSRVPTVQIERNEQTEQQAKKSFFKTFQSYADKYQQKSIEKTKMENAAAAAAAAAAANNNTTSTPVKVKTAPPAIRAPSQLERKIANLQQRCTIEASSSIANNKSEKLSIKPIQTYPPGFTVSKVESGAMKRKSENDDKAEMKRPSLEITLINPLPPETKPKRPPPATIPLERIKKSMQLNKIALSMQQNKCDNIGALDLSAKNSDKTVNGFASPSNNNNNNNNKESQSTNKSVNISNLQMLSKVATEINKSPTSAPKVKPQMPNLQTLKIPSPHHGNNARIPNLDKLPKLTEINKSQFRLPNPQIRNLRPNQNQNIRNIPNPSLLVRQQNQNRLNSMNPITSNNTNSNNNNNNNNNNVGSTGVASTTTTSTNSANASSANDKKESSPAVVNSVANTINSVANEAPKTDEIKTADKKEVAV